MACLGKCMMLAVALASPAALAAAPNLSGSWQGPCVAIDLIGSTQTTYSFGAEDGAAVKTIKSFSDKSCVLVDEIKALHYRYKLNNDTTVPRTAALDLTFARATLASGNEQLTANLNSSKRCGLATWATGKAEDVTGKNCVEGLAAPGTASYDLVTVVTRKSSSYLLFGLSSDERSGATPDDRPVDIDEAVRYHHIN